MKAMARICSPCRLSLQCSLHVSTLCLNNADTSTTPHNKSSAPHQEMDFMKATEILFSEDQSHQRKKKFGWDFHLWQAFVACLPSVAVYLTAQYARHDMEKVKAKLEQQNAEKLKVEEQKLEEEARKVPGFRRLEDRLDKMEEKISKIESIATQTKAAAEEDSQAEKVKKHKDNVKAGKSDTTWQDIKDAKAPGNVAQNIPVKETEETKRDPVKPQEGEPKKGDPLDMPSKAVSGENVKDGQNIQK